MVAGALCRSLAASTRDYAMIAVGADCTEVMPAPFVAVTSTARVEPTSAAGTIYVVEIAPEIATH